MKYSFEIELTRKPCTVDLLILEGRQQAEELYDDEEACEEIYQDLDFEAEWLTTNAPFKFILTDEEGNVSEYKLQTKKVRKEIPLENVVRQGFYLCLRDYANSASIEGELECDEFDPAKLQFLDSDYSDIVDVDQTIVNRIWYDGEELDIEYEDYSRHGHEYLIVNAEVNEDNDNRLQLDLF